MVLAYVRTSDVDQNDALQRDALAAWSKMHGVALEWFSDRFTGRTMDRPGWRALWKQVERGRVERVVVWKLDRLGRTCSGLSRLFDDLRARKIGFVSLTESIDLATAAGRMTANILASVAEFEREIRAERQRAGIEAARRRNGGRCPWGGSRPQVPKKLNPDQVAYIHRAKDGGETVSAIARCIGCSRQTVYRVLSWRDDGDAGCGGR